jgi:hypothetical protein
MFFPEEDGKAADKASTQMREKGRPQDSSDVSGTTPRSSVGATSKKDDWLGIDDSSNVESPFNSLENMPSKLKLLPSTSPVRETNQSQRKMSDDLNIDTANLLKMLSSKSSAADKVSRKPPVPTNTDVRGRNVTSDPFSTSRSQSPTVESNLGGIIARQGQGSFPGMESSADGFNNSLETVRPTAQQIGSDDPQPSAIQMPAFKGQPSFLESLPFLNRQNPHQSKLGMVGESGDVSSQSGTANLAPSGNISSKKKGTKASAPAGSNISTLQLPSHLVNEDELKTMSSSLKTLYSNQLEMLENSYKEQLEFLTLSHKRREDLLKDELVNLHEDYEQRIKRLKVRQNETEM